MTIRRIYFAAGILAAFLGIIGIPLPLLPSTPFLILAAFFFSKSSPAWHQKLLSHPKWGPPILDWQENGVISTKAKVLATCLITVSFSYSLYTLQGKPYLQGFLVILAICLLSFILSRPSKPKKQ